MTPQPARLIETSDVAMPAEPVQKATTEALTLALKASNAGALSGTDVLSGFGRLWIRTTLLHPF